MDHMEKSCVLYVNGVKFDQLEQNKIWVGTVTAKGMVREQYKMTWFLVSVSHNLPGIPSNKHHQMSFPWENWVIISDNHKLLAVRNVYLCILIVLTEGPGNMPAVYDGTGKTVHFGTISVK